jgi:hypothetical protein
VLARFEDGRPAIVENRLGKGRAYYLAWCPLTREACLDADWRRFFTEWHAALGGKTGLDVWRFRLPLLASADESDPEGVCLTGNYGLWDRYEFIEGKRFNRDTGGEYVLEAGGRRVVRPFRDGRLTDRLQLRTRDVYGGAVHPLDWARRFSAANWAEALDDPGPALVTFDFRQEYPMGRVRMFYSGVLPGAAVSVSRDGATWTDTAAVAPSRTGEKEVAMQDVPLAPARTGRYLRLALPAREAKDGLLLIEVEVWAKE